MTIRQAGRIRRLRRTGVVDRPAAVVLSGSALAWAALALLWFAGGVSPGPDMLAGHAHHGKTAGTVVNPWTFGWVGTWLLMVMAMMWPLSVGTVRVVARAAFRHWRWRLIASGLAAGTALWLGLGLVSAVVAQVAQVPAGSPWWQSTFLILAVVVNRSARRARLLWQCLDLPPVAPGGRRGVVSAMRVGFVSWRRCALLCGPIMIAMAVGHSPAVMILASLAVWWEALHPRAWRDPRPLVVLGVAALWVAVPAVLPAVMA